MLQPLTHWLSTAESSHNHSGRVKPVFREQLNSIDPMIIAVFLKFSKTNPIRAQQKPFFPV
jgi:hypothetical protein